MRQPELMDVRVDGGMLRAARWGSRGPVVVAPHGITASWLAWAIVAALIGDELTLVAPDLRGRGASSTLPAPYGIAQHAKDCVAILDHLGAERCVVAGHSMGGWVAATIATRYPERVSAAILCDGGFPLGDPPPPGTDIVSVLEAVIGPALARLSMTFPSREAYFDFWRSHPSFADPSLWNDVVYAYFDYDLVGDEPELRSRVSLGAVRVDATDTTFDPSIRDAAEKIGCPLTWIRAERGMLNGPPLYTPEAVAAVRASAPALEDILVEGVNHYTLLMGDRGATIVAEQIRKAAGVS